MPRFYFDVRDGDRFTHDDEGVELVGIEAARDEATRALGEIARERERIIQCSACNSSATIDGRGSKRPRYPQPRRTPKTVSSPTSKDHG